MQKKKKLDGVEDEDYKELKKLKKPLMFHVFNNNIMYTV